MDREASSEEKLLKLIRKNDQPAKYLRGNAPRQDQRTEVDVPRFLNKFLVIAFLGLAVYMAMSVLSFNTRDQNNLDDGAGPLPKEGTSVSEPARDVKPLAYYEEIIAQRDIFNTSFQRDVAVTPAPQPEPPAVNPIQNLRLVGIILSERSQAIIQNQQTQETFFLFTGDVAGDIKVREITADKVIMEYQQQEFELVL